VFDEEHALLRESVRRFAETRIRPHFQEWEKAGIIDPALWPAAGQAGLLFKRMYEEMARLKGVSLRTHVSGLMGMDMTTEATAVSTAPIPEATWALPVDYALKDGGKELKGKH